jgi:DNA transformation protein and related proteins
MSGVGELPNIGPVVAAELLAAGIATADELLALGSVGAGAALRAAGFDVCSSKLGGLEGAIRGVRWHDIPAVERAALRRELDAATDGADVPRPDSPSRRPRGTHPRRGHRAGS